MPLKSGGGKDNDKGKGKKFDGKERVTGNFRMYLRPGNSAFDIDDAMKEVLEIEMRRASGVPVAGQVAATTAPAPAAGSLCWRRPSTFPTRAARHRRLRRRPPPPRPS